MALRDLEFVCLAFLGGLNIFDTHGAHLMKGVLLCMMLDGYEYLVDDRILDEECMIDDCNDNDL